ncbi:MAG: class I SAM-dependent methyltransferase [Luteolibacter sp.]
MSLMKSSIEHTWSLQSLTDEEGFDLHWQMTSCERLALQSLLRSLRPALALEIGTYRGGSLQVLSRFSDAVISVDIDPEVEQRLSGRFQNVKFVSADSSSCLPDLVRDLNARKQPVGFVLVDGDHSSAGVRRDINALLELQPQQPLVMIMHDSFNPACREGMRTADWSKSPYVRHVELDFIPGIYHHDAHDTAEARSMWGGFACAVLDPQKREGSLIVHESQRGLHEAVKRDSRHRFDGKGRISRKLLRMLGKLP